VEARLRRCIREVAEGYSNTIVASFAGHTHMDDFRLIGGREGRYAFALITPAVSPIFGQNPGFPNRGL
jgi:hypothetical protein